MARINVLAEAVKGLKANIYAVDNLSPVSRVAVYVKAGSRYEPDDAPGITHYISSAARLSNQNSTSFAISRYLDRNGASLKVSQDREHIIYRIDCLRNKLGNVLHFIDDAIHHPEFRSWELVDVMQPLLTEELKRLKKNHALVTNEALHKAAYRGGLAHSTLIPEHQISKIKKKDLLNYVQKNYVSGRISIVGTGVDENDLRSNIEQNFDLKDRDYAGVSGATRYVGGEARIQAGYPQTMVNFAVEGCAVKDMQGQAILEILSSILGDKHQTYVKYGIGPERSLNKALNGPANGIKSSIININHSDTGLFGFSLQGPNTNLKDITKRAVGHVKKVLSDVKESDVKVAKANVKARALISSENGDHVFSAMGLRHANGVAGQSPINHLEKISLKDVQDLAGKLLKRKATIVSVGNARYVPYLDELDS